MKPPDTPRPPGSPTLADPTPAAPRRVLVIEDSTSFRVLLAAGLQGAGFEVTTAGSAKEALAEQARFDPDAAIVDIDLGSRPNGLELSRVLRHRSPHLAIIFLTSFPRPPGLRDLEARGGQFGFMLKSDLDSLDRLVALVDAALRGQEFATTPGARAASGSATPSLLTALTDTQLDALRMVAAGWSNVRISHDRGVTVRSVERLLDRVYTLLGLDSTDEAHLRVLAAQAYTREFGFPGLESHESPR